MSARKQILLKHHRRQKRIALLLALALLAIVGVLVAWWWVPVLLLLGWIAHEAWFADHLFYSPSDDYSHAFAESTRIVNSRIDAGCVKFEGELETADTLILQVHIKASWLGRWFDPYVLIGYDRQDFERGRERAALPEPVRAGRAIGAGQAVAARSVLPSGSACHAPRATQPGLRRTALNDYRAARRRRRAGRLWPVQSGARGQHPDPHAGRN